MFKKAAVYIIFLLFPALCEAQEIVAGLQSNHILLNQKNKQAIFKGLAADTFD